MDVVKTKVLEAQRLKYFTFRENILLVRTTVLKYIDKYSQIQYVKLEMSYGIRHGRVLSG